MKKKSISKSKDREKNKSDDPKSQKHSRRRRKSSSSESEDEPTEASTEPSEDAKGKRNSKKNEPENNVGNMISARSTRHSRRLAAIGASSEDLREEMTESVSSPVKTGKSSPYSSGSPRKRDPGTPDKHRVKEQDVWKVKSANGAGSGELQKLKICRQRSPEAASSQGAEETELTANDYVQVIEQPVYDDGTENIVHVDRRLEITVTASNEVDVASIQLPPSAEFLESAVNSSPGRSLLNAEAVVEINHVDLIITTEKETVDENALESKETKKTENEAVTSESVVEDEKLPDTVAVSENVTLPETQEQTASPRAKKIFDVANEETASEMMSVSSADVESEPSTKTAIIEDEEIESTEKSELVFADQEIISEPDDGSQAEIVLTVEENAIEDADAGIVNVNSESVGEPSKIIKSAESRSAELIHSRIKQLEDEEVYDYENDDTKEEGELSGNEAMSPIHEVFKKYSVDERKRSWGLCCLFKFGRTIIVADEKSLKKANIRKRTVSKEELDASDSEDLIFVKEIREENIVHEIESETNNTCHFEKEDGNPRGSPKLKSGNSETEKKRTSENDKTEKSSKRHLKENKSLSGEGRTVLYITNLVRPFTVNQLRELLLRTGRIVEDGFWIDSIKSKCYVQFETEDEALETRHALHGIRWPVNNPKVLCVQFATQDELLSAQAQTHESEIPRKTEPLVVSNHSVEMAQKRIDWKKHFEQYDERPRKKIKDVREWDIGKPEHPDEMVFTDMEEQKRKDEQERLRKTRKDKRKRNEASDDEVQVKKPKKSNNEVQPVAEAKLLDDLFRRTKASPSIYWLPLSEEQIVVKQEARRKHLEKIDKEMKQRGAERDSRRRDRDRRRSRR